MDKKYKFIVRVPKTRKGAYNHHRFISSLIQHQLKHLREAEKKLPRKDQTATDITKIKTELQASKYIEKVTSKLHPQGAVEPPMVAKTKTAGKRPTMKKGKQKKSK
jgi:hypothetical protein